MTIYIDNLICIAHTTSLSDQGAHLHMEMDIFGDGDFVASSFSFSSSSFFLHRMLLLLICHSILFVVSLFALGSPRPKSHTLREREEESTKTYVL